MVAAGYDPISEGDDGSVSQLATPPSRVRAAVITLGVAVCGLTALATAARDSVNNESSGDDVNLAEQRAASPVTDDTPNDYAIDVFACTNWDDDTVWGSTCGYNDFHAWCNHSTATGSGTGFSKYCSKACDGTAGNAYAMVCAWEAVAHLPEVCAESFNSTSPAGLSENLPNNNDFRTTLDLWDCDEHAFCNSCSDDNIYCAAVAAHYGGAGVPYNLTDDILLTYVHTPDGETKIGANAAMRVLNDDISFWCEESTIKSIESGAFFTTTTSK